MKKKYLGCLLAVLVYLLCLQTAAFAQSPAEEADEQNTAGNPVDEAMEPIDFPLSFDRLKTVLEEYDWGWFALRDAILPGKKPDREGYKMEILEIGRENDGSTAIVNMRSDQSFTRKDGSPVRQLDLSLGLSTDLWTDEEKTAFRDGEWALLWDFCGRLLDAEEEVEEIRKEFEAELEEIPFEEIEFVDQNEPVLVNIQSGETSFVGEVVRYQNGWIGDWSFNWQN